MMLRRSNPPRFAGHGMSTQRKNIFEFFVAHTMCPFYRTVFAVELEWLEAHPVVSQISRNSEKRKKDVQMT